jgi:hypothetical protein
MQNVVHDIITNNLLLRCDYPAGTCLDIDNSTLSFDRKGYCLKVEEGSTKILHVFFIYLGIFRAYTVFLSLKT